MMRTPELMTRIHELEGMQLCCLCNPFPSHGDIIMKLFKEINYGKKRIYK